MIIDEHDADQVRGAVVDDADAQPAAGALEGHVDPRGPRVRTAFSSVSTAMR
jgi:hypothetical protein